MTERYEAIGRHVAATLGGKMIRQVCACLNNRDAQIIATALNTQVALIAALHGLDQALGLIKLAGEPQERRLAVDMLIEASSAAAQTARDGLPEGMVLIPSTPPFKPKYAASGVRTVNGERTTVWLRYSEEGGGWYQWDTSKSGAHLFDSEEEAWDAALGCPGPHYNMPAKSSIAAHLVDCPKAKAYRAFVKAHGVPLPEKEPSA